MCLRWSQLWRARLTICGTPSFAPNTCADCHHMVNQWLKLPKERTFSLSEPNVEHVHDEEKFYACILTSQHEMDLSKRFSTVNWPQLLSATLIPCSQ